MIYLEHICNFADDNTLYGQDVKHRINCEVKSILKWFSNNGMVVNPDKFQAIFLGTKESP